MAFDLGDAPLLQIFVASLIAVLGAAEVGRRLGARAEKRGRGNDATIEAAILGLLALMISFTFAMALSQFEVRRDAVIGEANAIGTTALRARLLQQPYAQESLALLQEYTQIRLYIAQHTPTSHELNAAIEQSNAIQETLWRKAMAAAAKDPGMVPTGLYINSLNELIDDQQKRLAALRNRVPNIALLALYGIASVAAFFGGYGGALEARRGRLPASAMAGLVAVVLLLIQDLGRPDAGFITASQRPMVDTAAAISAYVGESQTR